MKKTIHRKAQAKINLTLEIIKKREDGFHDLRSVILKLENIFDEIEVSFLDNKGTKISSASKEIPLDERNICYKIAKKFFEKIGKEVGVKIHIKKNIPTGAGVGGGSSNAATVLKILNDYFEKPLDMNTMVGIAAEVGKDVPVFLSDKEAVLIKGTGERISEELNFSETNFLLINPKKHISTPNAFKKLDDRLWFMENKSRNNISKGLIRALEKGVKNSQELAGFFYNDFEVAMEENFPVISELKQSLIVFGAQGALMSGSGSTVFGVFDKRDDLILAKEEIEKKYPEFVYLF